MKTSSEVLIGAAVLLLWSSPFGWSVSYDAPDESGPATQRSHADEAIDAGRANRRSQGGARIIEEGRVGRKAPTSSGISHGTGSESIDAARSRGGGSGAIIDEDRWLSRKQPQTYVDTEPPKPAAAREDLSTYGRKWEAIQNEWNTEKARHSQRVAEIQKQFPEGPRRSAALEAENARHMSRSRELGTQRNEIHQKVIEEANRRVSSGATEASQKARQTAGTKPGEKGYRGMSGDLDTGAGAKTVDAIDDVLKDMGIKVDKKVHGGTVEYGGDFNLTVNKEGRMGRPGSGAHQTQIAVDARNPETYVSEGMAKNQPGRIAVEVQDHLKKGAEALKTPPEKLASNPDLQQKMAKSAHKVMNTGTVSDGELQQILKESGINESPQEFRERMERIKEGRAKPGDVTPENAGKLQEATRRIGEKATETSGRIAEAEIRSTRERIAELERAGTPEARAKAQKLREQLVDSKTRIEETRAATQEKMRGPSDVDGPGVKRGASETAGKGPRDVDGPGTGPRDVDGPGVKGGAPEAPGKLQQAGKVVGDYMECVMILEQAEKIREGIKTGDETKIAEGLVGEDLAKRTKMEGAQNYATAMGELEQAKKAEADMAESAKLRRMGATPEEVADYQKAKNQGDYEKARKIAHAVRDRGGKDLTPEKGQLEGAPPEDSGWDLKDQLKEGAEQAGSYLKWGANILTGGFSEKREAAKEDAEEMATIAGDIENKTKEQVRQSLINKLAGTGELSVREARELVEKLERGERDEFNRVVGELREKGAFEKGKGKYGLTPDSGVDIPKTDYGQEAKDTAKGLKEALVDRPADILVGITEDALEATVGSDRYKNERYEAERNKERERQKQENYDRLIRMGATPEQAREALDGPMGSVMKLVKELREKQEKEKEPPKETAKDKKQQQERDREKGKSEKIAKDDTGKQDKETRSEKDKITSDIFDTPEREPSDRQDFAKQDKREPYSGPVNDAGQRVDTGAYDEGDTVVTSDGTEWKKKDGQWAKTGNNYGPYTPDGLRGSEPAAGDAGGDSGIESSRGGSGLEGFTSDRGDRMNNHIKGSYGLMSGQREITEATSSSEQAERESRGLVNTAGNDAQATGAKSAATTAAGDREESWGKAIGDGIQQGIEKGLSSAAETFGTRAADRVSNEILPPPKKESGQSGSGSSGGGSADSGAGQGGSGGAQPPSGGAGGGGGGAKGGGKQGGGQQVTKGKPPSPPGNVKPPAPHHCPKCGRTDLVKKEYEYVDQQGQHVGVTEWRCPACNVVGHPGPPPPELVKGGVKPPPVAPPPVQTPPSKKYKTIVRCPICKSTSVTPYQSSYGPAYKCAGCGRAIKAYAMIYEKVEE